MIKGIASNLLPSFQSLQLIGADRCCTELFKIHASVEKCLHLETETQMKIVVISN